MRDFIGPGEPLRGGRRHSSTLTSAIDHLATLEDIDTDRVVALGHSAGGHLAA